MHIMIVRMHILMNFTAVMHIIVMMHINAYYCYCYDAYYNSYGCCYAYYCLWCIFMLMLILAKIVFVRTTIVVMYVIVMTHIDAYSFYCYDAYYDAYYCYDVYCCLVKLQNDEY